MRTAWTSGAVALALAGCGQEYEVIQGPVDIDPGDVAECGFTPISGTRMSEYDCNPVFTGTDEGWGDAFISVGFRTQEVLGHPFYQIWYSARPEGSSDRDWGLGYAVSDNGTDWTSHPDNPLVEFDPGAWDEDQMDAIQVIWDESRAEYVLWYQGFDVQSGQWGMGIKTSPDGIAWSDFNDGDMVLDFSSPTQGVSYCWPLGVSYVPGIGYNGYIAGQPGALQNVCQAYRFTGDDLSDGSSFVFGSEPLLEAGPESYDAAGHASVAVVEWAEGEWYMFYVGFKEWVQQQGYQSSNKHSFLMATSDDGIHWDKSPDNPLPISRTTPGVVRDVAAQKYGSKILLWVTDFYEEVGPEGQMAVGFYMYEPDIDVHP